MSDHKDVLSGREAQAWLDSPITKELYSGIEFVAIEALAMCSLKDSEEAQRERKELIWHLQMSRKQQAMVRGMVETGKFAQRKIDLDIARDESAVKRFARKVVNG